MSEHVGLLHFWEHADFVIKGVAFVLFVMSIASWYLIVIGALRQGRANRAMRAAPEAFWHAESLPQALDRLGAADASGGYTALARAGSEAADAHRRAASRSIGAGVSASDFVTRALRGAMTATQARMERGLTVLASIGSTAPFIGLFGTVWGIYHALVSLSGAQTVVLDRVAGPVGEALIMTALGLFVAIPAVLGYNALVRGNRVALAELDGFARDLHAYLCVGSRPGIVEGETAPVRPLRAEAAAQTQAR